MPSLSSILCCNIFGSSCLRHCERHSGILYQKHPVSTWHSFGNALSFSLWKCILSGIHGFEIRQRTHASPSQQSSSTQWHSFHSHADATLAHSRSLAVLVHYKMCYRSSTHWAYTTRGPKTSCISAVVQLVTSVHLVCVTSCAGVCVCWGACRRRVLR
jgi:hypothetical protein